MRLILKELINYLAALRPACLSWCIKACRRKNCVQEMWQNAAFSSLPGRMVDMFHAAIRLAPFLMRVFCSVREG